MGMNEIQSGTLAYLQIITETKYTKMNKKLIKLTESDLHRIVKESVNRMLRESNALGKVQEYYSN